MTEVIYYKALRHGRRGTHTDFVWPPPGEWVEVEGDLVACRNGLHVLTARQVLGWLSEELWLVEVAGELIDAENKSVARRARLVEPVADLERLLRLFAADCAERVLPVFEAAYPDDDRPRRAIEAARQFARGEIGAAARDAARAAAWAAARAAARAAAGDAARAAAWAAAGDAAGDAARAAARDAAGDPAWDAAWAGARDAERDWQAERLTHYLTDAEFIAPGGDQ